ncbi:DUF5130 family protein [uncultured Nocardioides sp.]|uniref:DUF5130 family protein n=1 Tax=uncultured Nocardioides sp. TaxID=198441 RepID=UPI00262334ED|nr:DUF5130 family protein [uncultured Nocardioides sp.]
MRGETFSASQRQSIDVALRRAEEQTRLEFSVFAGETEGDSREYATRLHNSLVSPSHSVLIMLDPVRRVVEVVTGAEVRRRLPDTRVHFAVLQMETAFAQGDFVGGLTSGIAMMADTAASS